MGCCLFLIDCCFWRRFLVEIICDLDFESFGKEGFGLGTDFWFIGVFEFWVGGLEVDRFFIGVNGVI